MRAFRICISLFLGFAVAGLSNPAASEAVQATTRTLSEADPVLHIRHPYVPNDPVYLERSRHFFDLLDLVMSKTGRQYELEAVAVPPVPSSRNVMFMNQGRYDVAWMHTDVERERVLRPVRYPIYRGIGGWRLFFIRPESRSLFSAVHDLEGLGQFSAGQGHDWPDTEILVSNGLLVRTAISRGSLFQMLRHHRVDYFPRGVNEIWDEVTLPEAEGLVVEDHLVLRYPTAFYFFVSRDKEWLGQLLESGFEKAIADGSYQTLFMNYFGDVLRRARLAERTQIVISNPVLSEQTPLGRRELWFDPQELRAAK